MWLGGAHSTFSTCKRAANTTPRLHAQKDARSRSVAVRAALTRQEAGGAATCTGPATSRATAGSPRPLRGPGWAHLERAAAHCVRLVLVLLVPRTQRQLVDEVQGGGHLRYRRQYGGTGWCRAHWRGLRTWPREKPAMQAEGASQSKSETAQQTTRACRAAAPAYAPPAAAGPARTCRSARSRESQLRV